MENKIPYSQRNFRGKFKYSMLFFSILLSVTLVLWIVTFRGYQLSNIVKQNIIVDVPLVGYDVVKVEATKPTQMEIIYHYKYEDGNGVIYKGDVRTHIFDYEIADEAIENGQTVKIYIDGKGNSCLGNKDISQTKIITMLVFSIILTIGTVIFFIIFLIPKKQN